MVDSISSFPAPSSSSTDRAQAPTDEGVCEATDPAKMVCEAEPELPPPEDHSSMMPSGRAKVNLSLDDLDASSDLRLSLNDRNGLNRTGRDDISGSLDGTVSLSHNLLHDALQDLVGQSAGDAKITGLHFDAKSQSYVLSMRAEVLWVLHDNMELKIRTNDQGQLYLQVGDNWVPNSSVLSRVRNALESKLQQKLNGKQNVIQLSLNTHRDDDKLYLTPQIKSVDVPLSQNDKLHLEGLNTAQAGRFQIDSDGNLHANFDGLHFYGSSDSNGPKALPSRHSDSAQLEISSQLYRDESAEISANGHISLDLDTDDTQQITLGGENLGKRVSEARLEAQIDTDASLDPQQNLQVDSHNHWQIKEAQIQGRRYDIASDQIDVSLDTQAGLKLDVHTSKHTVPEFKPQLTQNVVEPVINGPAYDDEMLKAIGQARESIEQETFLMYAGDKTQALMRALALKAAGLKEGKSHLVNDPLASKGIPVRVLFNNNKLSHEGALPTIHQFEATVAELKKEIQQLPISDQAKQVDIQRLESHLQWGSIERGVAKADHRKLLVIDGQTGYAGGINMGNHFLQEDSYHDIMLKVNGPAVSEMQKAFIENWTDFTGQTPADWNHKTPQQLARHRDHYAHRHRLKPTGVDVVTTDERKTEIEKAYLHAIHEATDHISIEQAYYFYPPVQAALKQALARGVRIDIIVPERSDEELFDIINLHQIQDLMQTQKELGRGEVNAWLYQGDGGKYSHTAHTKALSSDGQRAVVGSANLLPRSLHSPFTEERPDGSTRQVLFNEEMSLYLEGHQVQDLEQRLFETDKAKALLLNPAEVQRRIEKLGGEKELQESLLKAQLT